MYIVKNSQGEIVAVCSREEDAQAFVSGGNLDKETYTLEVDKQHK